MRGFKLWDFRGTVEKKTRWCLTRGSVSLPLSKSTKGLLKPYQYWDVYHLSTGAGFRNHPLYLLRVHLNDPSCADLEREILIQSRLAAWWSLLVVGWLWMIGCFCEILNKYIHISISCKIFSQSFPYISLTFWVLTGQKKNNDGKKPVAEPDSPGRARSDESAQDQSISCSKSDSWLMMTERYHHEIDVFNIF